MPAYSRRIKERRAWATVEIRNNTSCQKWLIIFKAAKQGFTIDGIQLPGPQYQFLDWVTRCAEEGMNPFLCALGLCRFYRTHIEHRSLGQYQLEFLADISKEIPEKNQSLLGQIAVVFEHLVGCHRKCVQQGSHSCSLVQTTWIMPNSITTYIFACISSTSWKHSFHETVEGCGII